MQKYIGSEISVITETGDSHRGELLSFDGKYILLKSKSGEITITNADQIVDYRFGSAPDNLILKPTLVWLVDSDKKQKSDCEVSYLTDGIDWHAEYVVLVDEDDKNINLSGWVSIDNKSGATYKDATLKLVAGKVNRITPRPMVGRGTYVDDSFRVAAEKEQFQEESFFEYHLYSLSRPATVANNEIKQITLFPEARTNVTKVYTVESQKYWYRGQSGKSKVKVNLEFENSRERGLGMPLPEGKMRVYKADSKGQLQFVGEDLIDHTPKDEMVRVFLGEAFDIKAERIKKNTVELGRDHYRDTYEITVKNHKDNDVTVTVIETMPGWREWHITETTLEYDKVSAFKVEFKLDVKANRESKITYTIEY
jgi:hypothetical protein